MFLASGTRQSIQKLIDELDPEVNPDQFIFAVDKISG